ncbi:hypothetical protein AB7M74_005300 [Bradyrhizobium japonicum]
MSEISGVLAAVLSSGLGGTSIGATRYLVGSLDPLAIGSFRLCVQRRLACSAGDKPAGVEVRAP